jgi:hypothetical protein
MIGIFLLFMILLMTFWIIPALRAKVKATVTKIRKDLVWNGFIQMLKIEYLNLCKYFLVFVQIERLGPKEFREKSEADSTLITSILFTVLLSMPLLIGWFLKMRDDAFLENKEAKELYGELYTDVYIKKAGSRYIFSIFMLERLVYVSIPLIFYNLPGIQIMVLIKLKMLVLSYKLYTNPWDQDKATIKLKMFAEIVHYLIFFLMMTLTDFQPELTV